MVNVRVTCKRSDAAEGRAVKWSNRDVARQNRDWIVIGFVRRDSLPGPRRWQRPATFSFLKLKIFTGRISRMLNL